MNRAKQPQLTVVSVWHNRANLVEPSLESLAAQQYRDLRLVLIDDGSTDSTFAEIQKFKQAHPGLDIVAETGPNIGLTAQLIRAIRSYAHGDYIALHGAGDISHPRRLELQMQFMESDPRVAACGTGVRYYSHSNDLSFPDAACDVPNTSPKTYLRPRTHGAVVMRRSAYLSCAGYNEKYVLAQDLDLWLRIRKFGQIRNLQNVLYLKYDGAGSITGEGNSERRTKQKIYSSLAIKSHIYRMLGLNLRDDEWAFESIEKHKPRLIFFLRKRFI